MSAIPTLILYVLAICWLEFSVCKPSAKNSHKISQFRWWCKCKMRHCFEICDIFIIVLIFEGNSLSHFATVTKIWFQFKFWRWLAFSFHHCFENFDFTSKFESGSPRLKYSVILPKRFCASPCLFIIKMFILRRRSPGKWVNISVWLYATKCGRFSNVATVREREKIFLFCELWKNTANEAYLVYNNTGGKISQV